MFSRSEESSKKGGETSFQNPVSHPKDMEKNLKRS